MLVIAYFSHHRWPRFLLALFGCLLTGGCASQGATRSSASEVVSRIERTVRAITIVSAQGREPPIVMRTVTQGGHVRVILKWIAKMERVAPGSYSCPQTLGIEPTVTLLFRLSAHGAVLARASEFPAESTSDSCNPLAVKVSGRREVDLVAGSFLDRVERLLHIDLGYGYGTIVGTVRAGSRPGHLTGRGGAAINPRQHRIEVYLANPAAFPGYGKGLLFGYQIGPTGQFSMRIAPGRYLLVVASLNGRDTCPRTAVRVRVSRTSHVNLHADCAVMRPGHPTAPLR